MIKIYKVKTLLITLLLVITSSSWAQTCYNSIGYFPSWQGDAAAIDYSKWTHINYAFGIPNADGTVGAIENSNKLVDLVNRAHQNNTKVLLAIGGWLSSSPTSTPFESIATNPAAVTAFANTCANLINQYGLDGIDIDWEYPTTQARWNAVINPLATKIHGMGKMLTAAVAGGAYYGAAFGDLGGLDLLNVMAYDCACPTVSPYSAAVDGLNYWAGRGVPKSKLVLGLPFYSSDNTTALHVQKANLAKSNASGIMVWEISSPGDINAIVSTLGTLCKGGTQTGVATVYQHCDFGGYGVSLPVGDYTLSQLQARGIVNDDVSSLKVQSGYEIQIFQHDNYGGTSFTFGSDDACLADNGANDYISSLKVRTKASSFSVMIQAESYNNMLGVLTETTTDTDGGLNVDWTDANDWMAFYNVNFPTSGSYLIEYRVASAIGTAAFSTDLNAGSIQLGSLAVPNTGGWQNWKTISHVVNINAGTYNFGIFILSGGVNMNWFKISKNGSARLSDQVIVSELNNTSMNLYPNPAVNTITIKGAKGATLGIVNTQGAEISKDFMETEDKDVSNLPAGIYHAVLVKNNKRTVIRFYKK